MIKSSLRLVIAGLLLAAVTSCASTAVVSAPSKITLEEAMASVGRGFLALQTAEKDLRVGIIPSDVTVTFNISASGQDSGKLYLNLNPDTVAVVKGGGELGSSLSASRGNQITIRFSNVLLADEKTLLAKTTDPEVLKKLLELLKSEGVLSR